MTKKTASKHNIQKLVDLIDTPSKRIIEGEAFLAKINSDEAERLYVQIICKKHGRFPQLTPLDLIYKNGGLCRKCVNQRIQNKRRYNLEQVKELISKKSQKIKQPITNVFELNYERKKNNRKRPYVVILCKKHGEFKVNLDSILYTNDRLCPMCGRERGGKLRQISFKEKKRLYKEKYPKSRIDLTETLPKSRIKAKCNNCNYSFVATWDSLFNRGTKCRVCATKERALDARLPFNEVQKRLKFLGLRIEGPYNGTHHKCNIVCLKCNDRKQLKPNTVFSHRRMACKCTRSIPDFCRDLIASDVLRYDKNAKIEDRSFVDTYSIIPDLFSKLYNFIIEVKYGNSCFGKPDGPIMKKKRFEQTLKQSSTYKTLDIKVVYIIVASKKNIEFVPDYLNSFEHYFIEDLKKFSFSGFKLRIETIEKLNQLYYSPVLVKDANIIDLPVYEVIRKKLFNLIEELGGYFPSQKDIYERVGVSIKAVDRAFGLGRNPTMKNRFDVLEKLYNIKVVPKIRYDGFWSNQLIPKSEKELFESFINLCKKNDILPFQQDIKNEIGVSYSRINMWLGLKHNSSYREICDNLRKRGIKIEYIPQIRGLSYEESIAYIGLLNELDDNKICGCGKYNRDGNTLLCDRCHHNAKRYYPKESRAKRSISFIKNADYKKISTIYSDNWKQKISQSYANKRPQEYNNLLEKSHNNGCCLCGNKVIHEPLCNKHLQQFKKVLKINSESTHSVYKRMVTYINNIYNDRDRMIQWLISETKILPSKLLSEMSNDFYYSQSWIQSYFEVIKFLDNYTTWPTETPGNKGYLKAKWINRVLKQLKNHYYNNDIDRKLLVQVLDKMRNQNNIGYI